MVDTNGTALVFPEQLDPENLNVETIKDALPKAFNRLQRLLDKGNTLDFMNGYLQMLREVFQID